MSAPSINTLDNGVVGNYWSDHNGSSSYVVDENNVDHHPLTQQVNISTTAPELSTIIVVIAIIVIVVVVVAGLLIYFKKRKH
jgi:heme/copper-type cytochrome/quinol oxidase subunit 2